ncbi:hypothetical protein ACHAPQ_011993 [Fusarium lateritium]
MDRQFWEAAANRAYDNYMREPPLSRASDAGNEVLFKQLLEKPENRQGIKNAGHDYLNAAIIQDKPEIVRALVSLPLSEFNFLDHPLASHGAIGPLHTSATHGRFAIFKIIVDTGKVDITGRDPHGWTPLHHASDVGSAEIVEFLLQHETVKADEKNLVGRTPLSFAAEEGMKNIVQILLRLDAVDPDSRDLEGHSPYYYAIRSSHDSVAKLLADTGRVDCGVKEQALQARRTHRQFAPIIEEFPVFSFGT